jgi:hypothetical protein
MEAPPPFVPKIAKRPVWAAVFAVFILFNVLQNATAIPKHLTGYKKIFESMDPMIKQEDGGKKPVKQSGKGTVNMEVSMSESISSFKEKMLPYKNLFALTSLLNVLLGLLAAFGLFWPRPWAPFAAGAALAFALAESAWVASLAMDIRGVMGWGTALGTLPVIFVSALLLLVLAFLDKSAFKPGPA